MLAKRIIPTILNKRGQLVKGKAFACDRVVGHALQAAKVYAMRGVDELMILDVTATKDGREPDYEFVKNLAENNFSPVTVGGGVKTSEHVRKLLQSGADKVCIGGAALENPDIINHLSSQYGSSTITVSIDAAKVNTCGPPSYIGYSNGSPLMSGRVLNPIGCAIEMEKRGAGEILIQSVERDGTMQGYDLDLIKAVSEAVTIPVIASGGCSGYEDAVNAIKAGASAVAVGALFQFTDATPRGAAEYLHERGVEVRL